MKERITCPCESKIQYFTANTGITKVVPLMAASVKHTNAFAGKRTSGPKVTTHYNVAVGWIGENSIDPGRSTIVCCSQYEYYGLKSLLQSFPITYYVDQAQARTCG